MLSSLSRKTLAESKWSRKPINLKFVDSHFIYRKSAAEYLKFGRRRRRRGIFRFLELPPESRNRIYTMVIDDGPPPELSRDKHQQNLASRSAMVLVNKQVQAEFLSLVNGDSRVVETTVINFDFSHIVRYLNRLSDAELQRFRMTTNGIDDATNDAETEWTCEDGSHRR